MGGVVCEGGVLAHGYCVVLTLICLCFLLTYIARVGVGMGMGFAVNRIRMSVWLSQPEFKSNSN